MQRSCLALKTTLTSEISQIYGCVKDNEEETVYERDYGSFGSHKMHFHFNHKKRKVVIKIPESIDEVELDESDIQLMAMIQIEKEWF